MKNRVKFDSSLKILIETVSNELGENVASDGVALRSATGELCFFVPPGSFDDQVRTKAAATLKEKLGAYANSFEPLIFFDDPAWQDLNRNQAILYPTVSERSVKLVDRRIVGSGWLADPSDERPPVPRIVFASIKGGVGRSTALAVTASDLAAKGRNVLVVDLDMEAPGLGDLLLDEDRIPRYGVLDFLVENSLNGIIVSELDDFVGTSPFTLPMGGRVDVVPVFGRESISHPEGVLPKLARAMIEDVSSENKIVSVGTQIATMINRLVERAPYDAVLIDSRAGLAELTAPAVLGLGASVLLFGTAQAQTIAGYRALFAALNMLAQRQVNRGEQAPWRSRLKTVYAKASLERETSERHLAELYDLFAENLYDAEDPDESGSDDSTSMYFEDRDESAPHWPLVIPHDSKFIDFDPRKRSNQLDKVFYEGVFRNFLDGIARILEVENSEKG